MSSNADEYEFTVDWHTNHANNWRLIFQRLLPQPRKLLEIGSFEGRSAAWFMDNVFTPDAVGDVYCIDAWQTSVEFDNARISAAEARFDSNIERAMKHAPHVKVHKIKQASRAALAQLLAEGHAESFDFIYVDGSHLANDVLTDLVFAFALCKLGGVIVCDDYLWRQGSNPAATPKLAIDSFVNCFLGKIAVLGGMPVYQLYLSKIAL
jgi:predicted O-methyltransferase YrrM